MNANKNERAIYVCMDYSEDLYMKYVLSNKALPRNWDGPVLQSMPMRTRDTMIHNNEVKFGDFMRYFPYIYDKTSDCKLTGGLCGSTMRAMSFVEHLIKLFYGASSDVLESFGPQIGIKNCVAVARNTYTQFADALARFGFSASVEVVTPPELEGRVRVVKKWYIVNIMYEFAGWRMTCDINFLYNYMLKYGYTGKSTRPLNEDIILHCCFEVKNGIETGALIRLQDVQFQRMSLLMADRFEDTAITMGKLRGTTFY